MFRWLKNIFTKKKVSNDELFKLTMNKKKGVWTSIMKEAVVKATTEAKNGKTIIQIDHRYLRCSYNDYRTREEILNDVKIYFNGCSCNYVEDAMNGNIHIRVSWGAKIENN